LTHNAVLNKCTKNIQCFNQDGRDFIKALVCGSESITPLKKIDHVIMNLPASAVSFLDVFNALFPADFDPNYLPTVHCYGFTKEKEIEKDILQQAEKFLGLSIPNPSIFLVRNVSPHKYMMRISFKLPLA